MKTLTSIITLSLTAAALTFSGCGSTTDDTTSNDTTDLTSGQLVDTFVENAAYSCEDGKEGLTDQNGAFSCTTLPVTFKFEGLKLGTIDTIPSDSLVFPQDLAGVARTETTNSDVVAMARFLQSCDEDGNLSNGIKVQEQVRNAFGNYDENFAGQNLERYADDANITLVDETSAVGHLQRTSRFAEQLNSLSSTFSAELQELLLTTNATLTQEVKDTLSYMGNEERLAHDVYSYLYQYHIDNSSTTLMQLNNIAT